MKEFKEIIESYKRSVEVGRNLAIGSVVHLIGSSYRRPGARMLVDDLGQLTGAISGGCLEGDALRKAMLVIAQQQSKLVTYDTSDEDDATIGVQLGCEGIIQVLFEPINNVSKVNAIKLLAIAEGKRQAYVLATLFDIKNKQSPQPGTCLLIEEDGKITVDIVNETLKAQVISNAKNVLEEKESKFIEYSYNDQTITAFIEYVPKPISLIVVGAGNDAIPMVNFAESLGWETMVVDGRNTLAKSERFISACQVLVSKPEKVLEQINIDDRTAFVLMTHNYNYDKTMLKALIQQDVKYIGSLGPKKKLIRMLEEIKEEGIELTNDQINKIYGPVGLEIGAETPEEIALSILAEIQAVFNEKNGGMLRVKKDVIHSRSISNISYNKIKYETK